MVLNFKMEYSGHIPIIPETKTGIPTSAQAELLKIPIPAIITPKYILNIRSVKPWLFFMLLSFLILQNYSAVIFLKML